MSRMSHLLCIALVTISCITFAGDLSALKACVAQGYNGMSNRHGIVAAVVDADSVQIMTFGAAQADQLFEIGSITKTFTANLLAQAVNDGSVKLSDPIPASYQKPGSTITYEQLTTHTSGIIAGIFPNFTSPNPLTPFDGLTIPVFKTQYALTPLATSPGTAWAYSNIGVSLLGLILAENAGGSYESLVANKILKVLGMTNTYFQVPDSESNRLADGHSIDVTGQIQNMPHWDLFKTAIDPAGGIRSSIADMAKYAQANLSPSSTPLAAPIAFAHKPLYFIKDHNKWIGMNWIVQPDIGLVWHNGETYGFNSILAMSQQKNQAVVAITDTTLQVKDAQGNIGFDTKLQDIAFDCLK